MPRFASLFAAALAAASVAFQSSHAIWIFNDNEVQERPVTAYDSAVLTTALRDPSAIAPDAGAPICVKKVNRAREGHKGNDLFIWIFDVDGCQVDAVTGLCSADCVAVPYEVVVSSTSEDALAGGPPIRFSEVPETPFKVESIKQL
ncbi:hypothetical protein PINS_up011627 [Pythium insidiosum]|nr:hypothetical protein PINS_up011627 [Pythium insidiosum]